MAKVKLIPFHNCEGLIDNLRLLPGLEWDGDKGRLQVKDLKGNLQVDFHLPLTFPRVRKGLSEYLQEIPQESAPFSLILIQAGAAALGFFANGEVKEHKAIKKYMIRGKGKAQVGYLKTRGKSKAGSRLRLRNSIQFFEEINEKLQEWEVHEKSSHLFYACPVRLWPLLFDSRVKTPFEKKDSRLQKVPKDIPVPNYEVWLETVDFVQCGRLYIHDREGLKLPRMW